MFDYKFTGSEDSYTYMYYVIINHQAAELHPSTQFSCDVL